jgi:hypothetical protein
MIGVIAKHRAAVGNIEHADSVPGRSLGQLPQGVGRRARPRRDPRLPQRAGDRARADGTISFMMDCDTTGVEPDFSLVKSKKLVGGGEITIVNKTVPMALERSATRREESRRSSRSSTSGTAWSARRTSRPSHFPSSTAPSASGRSTTAAT